MKSIYSFISVTFISIFSTVLYAEELGPYFAETPRAPAVVQKGDKTLYSLSNSETKEITSEFSGILYMAMRNYSYEKWPGKEMSDCQNSTSENWCHQCEMITGHAHAYYSFYKDPAQKSCTLQQVDVHFEVADPLVLKDLKRPVRSLLGDATSATKSARANNDWGGSGLSAWKWATDSDLAYLYMDTDERAGNGEGMARFQWRRSPLYDLYSPLAKTSHKMTSD